MKTVFSGVQPSGRLTLGNYLGAIKNWTEMLDQYNCIFMVADLHSVTVKHDPMQLRENSMKALLQFLACGLDPEKCTIYFQSHVAAHSQLTWLLSCGTYLGELSRMTQFKDKSKKQSSVGAGLLIYPVLMAADILLYQTHLVPVGADQKQHLELSRDVAMRFNSVYGETFVVPEPFITKQASRIMSLTDPTCKMSKSDPNPNSYIEILDEPQIIVKKIKRAVTDSLGVIEYKEGRDGINNLLTIYATATNISVERAAEAFAGKGYGQLKSETAEAVVEMLRPVRENYERLSGNMDYVQKVYRDGAEKASEISNSTIKKVYDKMGFAL